MPYVFNSSIIAFLFFISQVSKFSVGIVGLPKTNTDCWAVILLLSLLGDKIQSFLFCSYSLNQYSIFLPKSFIDISAYNLALLLLKANTLPLALLSSLLSIAAQAKYKATRGFSVKSIMQVAAPLCCKFANNAKSSSSRPCFTSCPFLRERLINILTISTNTLWSISLSFTLLYFNRRYRDDSTLHFAFAKPRYNIFRPPRLSPTHSIKSARDDTSTGALLDSLGGGVIIMNYIIKINNGIKYIYYQNGTFLSKTLKIRDFLW